MANNKQKTRLNLGYPGDEFASRGWFWVGGVFWLQYGIDLLLPLVILRLSGKLGEIRHPKQVHGATWTVVSGFDMEGKQTLTSVACLFKQKTIELQAQL